MDMRSEVLLRQIEYFTGNTLLAGLPVDSLLSELPDATGWSWFIDDYEQLSHNYSSRLHFGIKAPQKSFDNAVLFLPKSKDLATYLLQALASTLKVKGNLYLIGEKKAGIERAAKQLDIYNKASKLDSARHCQLWRAVIESIPEHPQPEMLYQDYHVNGLTIKSLAGVFSHGKLDIGTQLLIQHLDNIPTGRILDFGCGSGVIGSLLKQRYNDSTIYLQDIDAFAIASAEQTLKANNLHAQLITAGGINNSPNELSAIITNPPFHQGIQTNYTTAEQLLEQAVEHLVIGGELRLVANSFLKYQPIIERAFGHCNQLAQANGFRIYSAIKR